MTPATYLPAGIVVGIVVGWTKKIDTVI